MSDAAQLERLIDAVRVIADAKARTSKHGPGVLEVLIPPRTMKELISAFEPFRERSSTPKRNGNSYPFCPDP